MADTGWLSPTSSAESGTDWSNESNIYSSNNVYATEGPTSATRTTPTLWAYGFDFSSIGADDTINGIEVTVEHKSSANSATLISLVQLFDGTTAMSDDKEVSGQNVSQTEETLTYGGATDTWNWSGGITKADLDSTFRVGVQYTINTTSVRTTSVDHIQVKIHYTPYTGNNTGWLDPTANTTTGTGDASWTGGGNTYTSNDTDASVTMSTLNSFSDILLVSGFNFSAINSGDTIDGIEVNIERASSNPSCYTDEIVQLYDGTTAKGNNKADTVTEWTTTDTVITYGSSTDTWGWTGISGADMDSTFGVGVKVDLGVNQSRTAYIDHIQVKVYYTSSGTPDVTSFFLKLGPF